MERQPADRRSGEHGFERKHTTRGLTEHHGGVPELGDQRGDVLDLTLDRIRPRVTAFPATAAIVGDHGVVG